MEPKLADFSNISIGDTATLKRIITAEAVTAFARLTGDDNPLHMDDGFAAQTEFGGRIAHGMLSASYVSTIIGTMLPGYGSLWLTQSFEFLHPVRVGDEIEVVVRVEFKSEHTRVLVIDTEVFNQNRVKVIAGKGKVRIMTTTRQERTPERRTNRVALVTGASRGIGAAIARALARDGVTVIVNYHRSAAAAEQVVSEIRQAGGEALALQADVSVPAQVADMADRAQRQAGPVDILVNNAAPPLNLKTFADITWPDVEAHYKVTVQGAFNCCKYLLPGMSERKYGRIVNLISTVVYRPHPPLLAYLMAKSALHGFSRCLAEEYGPHGVLVNMVSPGMAETDLVKEFPERARKLYAAQNPLQRLAHPDEIAEAVSFLASDRNTYIAGANLPVCGGEIMQP
jgi:3-oxoacyl-[acyl-carrier protein] reductase